MSKLYRSIFFLILLLYTGFLFAHRPTNSSYVNGKYIFTQISNPADSLARLSSSDKEDFTAYSNRLYVKTNAPAWLLLWSNIAVEYDFAPHWSVALPIYYSGWNYFTSKLKFRTFSVVPEIRWWAKAENSGFFLNAHIGLNQFNYAKGGEWRYQTFKGHTPALGGGVGAGYKWYFTKNKRWTMEAGICCGVYHLDYSVFQNIPNGLIVDRKRRTFFGIDQASLSFAYSFNLQGRRREK